jgi:hypothetical protein
MWLILKDTKAVFYSLIHMYPHCFCSITINSFAFMLPSTIHRIHIMLYTHDK